MGKKFLDCLAVSILVIVGIVALGALGLIIWSLPLAVKIIIGIAIFQLSVAWAITRVIGGEW